jgi:hypothetical protein
MSFDFQTSNVFWDGFSPPPCCRPGAGSGSGGGCSVRHGLASVRGVAPVNPLVGPVRGPYEADGIPSGMAWRLDRRVPVGPSVGRCEVHVRRMVFRPAWHGVSQEDARRSLGWPGAGSVSGGWYPVRHGMASYRRMPVGPLLGPVLGPCKADGIPSGMAPYSSDEVSMVPLDLDCLLLRGCLNWRVP